MRRSDVLAARTRGARKRRRAAGLRENQKALASRFDAARAAAAIRVLALPGLPLGVGDDVCRPCLLNELDEGPAREASYAR